MTVSRSKLELSPYARGFSDAVESRPYSDGYSPRHKFAVFCPESIFSMATQREYRRGWLAGGKKFR